ncbi:MAG: UxaA family hydrolase [Cellvibrio sp.]|jgi:(2R)-sulfolactate sulfo-lyase subunit alpha
MNNSPASIVGTHARAILLHPEDNVLVCVTQLQPGDELLIDGREVAVAEIIGVGHKLARRLLRPGDKIIKYGAAVGSMTAAVMPGAHVHLHNMQSDYIPSHTRTQQKPTRSENR